MVAAVVRQLVPGRGLALGGASVAAMTSLIGQAAHRSEGEGAAIAELNLRSFWSFTPGTASTSRHLYRYNDDETYAADCYSRHGSEAV